MSKLLSSLPIGTAVKFGKYSVGSETPLPIVWVVADKNHSGYPNNSVTLLAKENVDLRAFDGIEGDLNNLLATGNNDYTLSNLHQWLNSDAGAGQWYSPTHTNDQPPNSSRVQKYTEYYTRTGFLYDFSAIEKSNILSSTIKVDTGEGGVKTITSKVFIPSAGEVGLSATPKDGTTILEYIKQFGAVAPMTNQAYLNTSSSEKPSPPANISYWTRSSNTEQLVTVVYYSGNSARYATETGSNGVRPIINLSADVSVSEIPDSDGCYNFAITNAPTAPTNAQILTSTIYTTKPCSVKWNGSTDPNGDVVNYRVHIYYNNVEHGNPVEVGTALTYTLPWVKTDVSSISFGIEAVDPFGHSSAITMVTGAVRTNNLPIISGTNRDMGILTEGFSHEYTVTDADKEVITVSEYIDNVKIRSYVATLGATNTFAVTGNTWLKLANGIHTLKITATDGIDEATRVVTFTKTVNTLVVQRVTPIASTTKPTRLVVTVVKSIPPEAIFKVEACNNGFDAAPAWEDITASITSGQTHVFSNTVKTAGEWGVNIRVTVDRNGGAGACYITEIGGNFE